MRLRVVDLTECIECVDASIESCSSCIAIEERVDHFTTEMSLNFNPTCKRCGALLGVSECLKCKNRIDCLVDTPDCGQPVLLMQLEELCGLCKDCYREVG